MASRIRPGAVAAAVVALPLGYYFLRSAPVGGQSLNTPPAQATFATPESRGAITPQRQTNTEDEANARSQILGSEEGVGNFRPVDPNARVKRGKNDEGSGKHLNAPNESANPSGQWRPAGAKHSYDIASDPTKSKKSTGEPETARKTGTVIPGGGQK